MTEEFLKIIKQRYATWQELENIKSINSIDYNDNIDSLIRFLKEQQLFLRYMGIKNKSQEDKYPIICYLKSKELDSRERAVKGMSKYADLYWDLQAPGDSFGPSDFFAFGKNRERFNEENENDIIYPLDGESFTDDNTFLKVQAEFIDEALRTDQEQAKRLILQKYRRR